MATTVTASKQPPAQRHEDRMLNVVAWLELHRKQLAAGALGLVLLFGAIYLWRHFAREGELKANTALFELRQRPNQPESAPKPGDYLKVAERYASTSVAARARLLAATALYGENRYAEAQAEFEKLVASGASGTLAAEAAFGIAASLDAQDKVDQAIAQYQGVIARFPEESVAGQARLALARIYEDRKQPELALKSYDELVRNRGRSSWAEEAAGRKEALLRRNPQLAGTNAPAAAAPALP